MAEEKMAVKPKTNSPSRWHTFWYGSGTYVEPETTDIPLPTDLKNKSVAEVLINPPKFPKLEKLEKVEP
jgi:hypothetical protein